MVVLLITLSPFLSSKEKGLLGTPSKNPGKNTDDIYNNYYIFLYIAGNFSNQCVLSLVTLWLHNCIQ